MRRDREVADRVAFEDAVDQALVPRLEISGVGCAAVEDENVRGEEDLAHEGDQEPERCRRFQRVVCEAPGGLARSTFRRHHLTAHPLFVPYHGQNPS